MHWTEDVDAVTVMPPIAPAKTTERRFFHEGDPRMGKNATVWGQDIANIIMCELLNLVEGSGLTLDRQDLFQVLKAVRRIAAAGAILPWDNAFSYSPLPWIVWGSDNMIYIAIAPSGPGTPAGPKDPTTTTGYWKSFGEYIGSQDGGGSGGDALGLVYPGAFHNFYEKTPPKNWWVRNGALFTDVDRVMPLLWEELQKPANSWKLRTESQWQALSAKFNGVGGVPFFVLNVTAKTIRLPDTQGTFGEDAGFDGLTVGGVHGDTIRNLAGSYYYGQDMDFVYGGAPQDPTGVFKLGDATVRDPNYMSWIANTTANSWRPLMFDASREVATGNKVAPRAFGHLGCVYIGPPAAQ